MAVRTPAVANSGSSSVSNSHPSFTNLGSLNRRLQRKNGKKPVLNQFSRDSSTINKTAKTGRTHTTYQAHRNGSLSWDMQSIPASSSTPSNRAIDQDPIFNLPETVDNLPDELEVDPTIYDLELVTPGRKRTESVRPASGYGTGRLYF